MPEYKNLEKYLEKKSVKVKEKVKPSIEFQNLSTGEKWGLVERVLVDLGYIEKPKGWPSEDFLFD